jgi:FSR family fosmidomycin resistance protein-like MFS transporter
MSSPIDATYAPPVTATAPIIPVSPVVPASEQTTFKVIGAISVAHFLNDMMQSLILAIYPLLKGQFSLSFVQIGYITLVYQMSASIFQPVVGAYTDKHPKPYSLAVGMGFTFCGLLLLSIAPNYLTVLAAAVMVGIGSSIFHPESSRVARLAAGGRPGLSQSIFQVGGNSGSAIGPLLAAALIIPYGQKNVAWFSLAALVGIGVLVWIGGWYKREQAKGAFKKKPRHAADALPRGKVVLAIGVLLMLIFSKYFYMASFTSYYTFYLIEKFGLSVQASQMHLFVFLVAMAGGTLLGGPIGDRIGRKRVIWGSILGVAPFALALPHVGLEATTVLSFIIGFILASAFSAILVFAQELIPGKVGMVSGLFFGFAFGMGGVGAAVLGQVADAHGIETVYQLCAYLPLLGLLTVFLPDVGRHAREAKNAAAVAAGQGS